MVERRLLIGAMLFLLAAIADSTEYTVSDGYFVTSEGRVPERCFGQLMTELNGDDTVAALFLSRSSIRGCVAANIPYPGGDDDAVVSYSIADSLGDGRYKLRICKTVDGSMGSYCDNVLVRFASREYVLRNGELKHVLSVEKIGEW